MRRRYLIAYDISAGRARRAVEAALLGVGVRVQRSVFECRLSPEEFRELRARVAQAIDIDGDSVRYYPICAWCERKLEGPACGTPRAQPQFMAV